MSGVPDPVSSACAPGVHAFRHQAMACTWGLAIAHARREYAQQAARIVFDEIDRLERELSRFLPGSDIARINALPAGGRLRLGPDAFECLCIARRMHVATFGAFDITIGALLAPGRPSADPPVGMNQLHIDDATRTVGVRAAGLVVDLGGIGKGYAIDRGIELLRDWNIHAALLHAGQSTVYALGRPPRQPGWRVELRDPLRQNAALREVWIADQAVSGSGALLHGRHIIDPRTRRPAAGALGAWALAPAAAVADALSTAFMVLSPDEVQRCCAALPQVTALLLPESPGGAGKSSHRWWHGQALLARAQRE